MKSIQKDKKQFILDNRTYELIYNQYRLKLLKYVIVIVKNQDFAQDVVQNVFLKLPQIIQTFNQKKGDFDNWIFKVTRNEALYFLRKENLIRQRTCQLDEEVASDYSNNIKNSFTFDLMKVVDAKEMEYIMLEFVYGFNSKEIAEIMKISVSTKKRLRKTVLEKLKKYFKENNIK